MRLEHDWFPQDVPENVEIGERSWLYSAYAFRHFRSRRPLAVRVGRSSGLYAGTFFDLGPDGEVDVGDFCTLVGVVFCTNARVEVAPYVFVAHEVTIADGPVAVPFPQDHPSTGAPRTAVRIGEAAWIGARAVLLAGAAIGEGAIVGAGAVVDFEVPPRSIAAGNPARVVGVVGRG